jgi:hypothetical protein
VESLVDRKVRSLDCLTLKSTSTTVSYPGKLFGIPARGRSREAAAKPTRTEGESSNDGRFCILATGEEGKVKKCTRGTLIYVTLAYGLLRRHVL